MKQIPNYGDRRQFEACAYCRGACETRDHVPSRVLLDEPFPENMAVVSACLECNNLISADEQYLACLLECVLSGTTDPSQVRRQKIARLLLEYPLLRQRIAAAHRQQGGHSIFDIEAERVKRVVIKLAQGHSLYELNEPQTGAPDVVRIMPRPLMNTEELEAFESLPGGDFAVWPEAGSRAMQRIAGGENFWIEPQRGRYRYMAFAGGEVVIRLVLSEYLACEVIWE